MIPPRPDLLKPFHPFLRAFIVVLLALIVFGLLSIPGQFAHSAEPSRPNIIVVLTDDEPPTGTLGVKPTVAAWLKADGTSFRHAYATTPYCCPSRASILTGLYAHNHGIMGGSSGTPERMHTVDALSVFPAFRAGGYRTGLYGKYLNGWGLEPDGSMNPAGWVPSGIDDYALIPKVFSWYDDVAATGTARWDVNGTVQRSPDYSTSFIRDRALEFIAANETNDAEPWIAYLAPITPHAPGTPEPKYARSPIPTWNRNRAQREWSAADRADKPAWLRHTGLPSLAKIRALRARQLRSLMSVDDLVAAVRSRLADLGEENTIVVYASDNGLAWGEHGRSGKMTPYVESVGVPLYIRGPGIPAGATRQDMVALLDLMPTLLTRAGIAYPREFDGHDLFDGTTRKRLLLELDDGSMVPPWKAVIATAPGSVAPGYEFIRYRLGTTVENEAYNLVADPWQLRNLRSAGRGKSLTAALVKLRSCRGETCATAEGRS